MTCNDVALNLNFNYKENNFIVFKTLNIVFFFRVIRNSRYLYRTQNFQI